MDEEGTGRRPSDEAELLAYEIEEYLADPRAEVVPIEVAAERRAPATAGAAEENALERKQRRARVVAVIALVALTAGGIVGLARLILDR